MAIQAAQPDASLLPCLPLASLCFDYVAGLCRNGERCPYLHSICRKSTPPVFSTPRVEARPLVLNWRATMADSTFFQKSNTISLLRSSPLFPPRPTFSHLSLDAHDMPKVGANHIEPVCPMRVSTSTLSTPTPVRVDCLYHGSFYYGS